MPKKSFTEDTEDTEEQIAAALRLAEAGTAVTDVCRRYGVTEVTFDRLPLEEAFRRNGRCRTAPPEAA